MSADRRYEFTRLPLAPVRGGRTIAVRGGNVDGADELVLRGTTPAAEDEGAIVVSTNSTGRTLLADRRDYGCGEAGDRVCVVDCVSLQQGRDTDARNVKGVSTPGDLTGVGMRTSAFYEALDNAGVARIRVGLLSVSTLLMYSELRTVSRFVHTLAGRVSATDGIALLALDADSHDERAVNTIEGLCDGRIDVRVADGRPELRIEGLPDQPEGWLSLRD